MHKISKEDFEIWMENPITLEVFTLIKEEAKVYREMASGGGPMGAGSFEKIGEKYFSLINTAQVYENLLDHLTYEEVFPQEETEDEV